MSPRPSWTAVRSELSRTNFAGRRVTLAEGVGVVAGCTVLTALRGRPVDTLTVLGIGTLGLVDDILEHRQRQRDGARVVKGLRGHLRALRELRPTTGGAKLVGIPILCTVAAATAPATRVVLLDGALAAGTANLANLLDLRPGRALKVLLPGAALLALPATDDERQRSGRDAAIAVLTVGAAVLPLDLREHGMLGDGGANTLGAVLGIALARRLPVPARVLLLAGVVALTVASEKVSFSAVIASHPVLASLDALGRRPPSQEGP